MVKVPFSLSTRLIGAALIASVFTSACSNESATQEQGMPPSLVEVQQVETARVQESSEFVGALEAQERVQLRPETEGRIVSILAQPGQRVEAGTPILILKSDVNQAQVSGAAADVSAAQAAVNTARARVQAAIAERDRAAADVELQTTEYERTAQLAAEGAQSQQALDQATNRRNTAIAALRAAEDNVGVAQAELNQAQAQFDRAQADQAVARSNLSDTEINAPIAGVVGNIPVRVGDVVSTQDVLTSIIQNQVLDLNISVPIERADQLRVGLPVELVDNLGTPLVNGEISFVSPEVNTTDQAVLAKASFPNDGNLKDGQFVRARIIWESGPGILIPTSAVTRIAGQTFVYMAEPGEPSPDGQPQMIARQQPVSLGSIQGNNYQVLSGVEAGDQVITSGVLNLMDGAPIMTGPPGGPPGQPGLEQPPG
ncbi:efflux RND transporter periplasmic adaptor subunit [Thermocoleostomius sinensis]|jgi:RND family efflux transporter MFP subunit|uniref:Efflux RND transporter periplasmic adaptor subunit n=1 Tax=Thermocoleostomius sinensis A174 TaxID=2016057 RepID=A0A9E8ZCK7_9CYAN|nr:efflux RND transporter periplasmic adaptor subunit [Thermocoleostomius sinensis]WAL60381.1 efflux RND transporter periplasmic adaptor subunit [Thermocoleostomius sinensis A174]